MIIISIYGVLIPKSKYIEKMMDNIKNYILKKDKEYNFKKSSSDELIHKSQGIELNNLNCYRYDKDYMIVGKLEKMIMSFPSKRYVDLKLYEDANKEFPQILDYFGILDTPFSYCIKID